mgnify:CR=1 FL=1
MKRFLVVVPHATELHIRLQYCEDSTTALIETYKSLPFSLDSDSIDKTEVTEV